MLGDQEEWCSETPLIVTRVRRIRLSDHDVYEVILSYLAISVLANSSNIHTQRLLHNISVGCRGTELISTHLQLCNLHEFHMFAVSSGNENCHMTSHSTLPCQTYLDETASCTEEIHMPGLWSRWVWGF